MTYKGDYLIHYGVLGMRWGHRKAAQNLAKYKQYTRTAKTFEKEGNSRAARKALERADRYKAKSKYKYTSWNTNRHARKAAKLAKKASRTKNADKAVRLKEASKKEERRAKASQKYDDLQSKYAKEQASTGASIAASLILNPSMRNSYQRLRASGSSKIGAAILSSMFGDAAGRMDKHIYIKTHS